MRKPLHSNPNKTFTLAKKTGADKIRCLEVAEAEREPCLRLRASLARSVESSDARTCGGGEALGVVRRVRVGEVLFTVFTVSCSRCFCRSFFKDSKVEKRV